MGITEKVDVGDSKESENVGVEIVLVTKKKIKKTIDIETRRKSKKNSRGVWGRKKDRFLKKLKKSQPWLI
ncbi:hypothetical protein HY345_03035, partial [Candidatus Microgenomates bacterium]|nr:hypothetical protein [Candidatus Microgenomates bacterium]